MAQTWIVRAGREDEYEQEALEQNVVAMGWQRLGDLTKYETQASLRTLVNNEFVEFSPDARAGTIAQVVAFRTKMRIGDVVILLRSDAPTVAIGTVTGDYAHRPELPAPHVRTVHWARTDVSPTEIGPEPLTAPALTSIYKIRNEALDARLKALLEPDEAPEVTPAAAPPPAPSPTTALAGLKRNLEYALNLATAGEHLEQLKVSAFEVSDVYRAAWVQAVATLDHWVHQEIRERMLALAAGPAAAKTKQFQKFQLPLALVDDVLARKITMSEAVDRHWNEAFAFQTFQNPDKIRNGLANVADVSTLWSDVAKVLNEHASGRDINTAATVQDRLREVVQRRNKIAHEYDEDPDNRPAKRPIDAASTTRAIRLIEQVAEALVVVLNGKS